jgi:EAL and modified HD-GYP domain-containing signal transduction protein
LVGRQPIADHHLRVFGYELLFRSPGASSAQIADGDQCTAEVVLNTFVEIGLDALVGEKRAFVNATRSFLVGGFARQLPYDRVVVEVLENVPADSEVAAAVCALRDAGFLVALDDFRLGGPTGPLLDLASIVKLDLRDYTEAGLLDLLRALSGRGVQVVVERVETEDEFARCAAAGAAWFQGYYIGHPVVVSAPRHKTVRVTTLRLLGLLADESLRTNLLVEAIQCDIALCHKLLRVINSAALGLASRITSLHQAIVYLGRERIRKWVSLIALSGFGPSEAVLSSALTRARMCESLGTLLEPGRGPTYFTVGLFSTLDVLVGMSMSEVVGALPLSEEINEALVGRRGTLGQVLTATEAYERCAWDELCCLGLDANEYRQVWLEAVGWTRQTERELGVLNSVPASAMRTPVRPM